MDGTPSSPPNDPRIHEERVGVVASGRTLKSIRETEEGTQRGQDSKQKETRYCC